MDKKETKQELREEAILRSCEKWAFITKDAYYLISIWELARSLNNCWKAHLFTNKKYAEKDFSYSSIMKDNWGVASYNVNYLFRMINWTINRMKKVKIIKQGPKPYQDIFYKIKM